MGTRRAAGAVRSAAHRRRRYAGSGSAPGRRGDRRIWNLRDTSVLIVTVTAGESGTADFSGVLPRGEPLEPWYARLRVWDSLTIPQLGGVPSGAVSQFGLSRRPAAEHARPPGGGVSDQVRGQDTSRRAAGDESLVGTGSRSIGLHVAGTRGRAGRIIDRIRPAVIVAPHPVLDTHPDHVRPASLSKRPFARDPRGRSFSSIRFIGPRREFTRSGLETLSHRHRPGTMSCRSRIPSILTH